MLLNLEGFTHVSSLDLNMSFIIILTYPPYKKSYVLLHFDAEITSNKTKIYVFKIAEISSSKIYPNSLRG